MKEIQTTEEVEKKKKVTRTRKTTPKKEENSKPEEIKEIVKEVIVEKKVGFNYAEVIVIMVITLMLGGIIGSFITYITKGSKKSPVINNIITENNVPDEMNEFLNTYNNIISDYYQDVDSKQLLEAGINGMLNYLGDDYSVYMDQETTKSFNEQVEGKYTGIGVEIVLKENVGVVINRVFANSPADKSGLKPGDVFTKVEGVNVLDKSPTEVSSMIKGSNKDSVSVVVNRDGEEKEFTLALKEVEIDSVVTKIFEKNNKKIGYIDISVFAANTYTQFEKALNKLEKEGIDSLVIDVRDNSGGYLSTVTDMVSLFLPKSKIIYQLDTKGVVEQIYSKTSVSRKYDVAVLVNKYSASASEILAAALQESYGAKIIGTNSFGKGTVQKAYQLESGATVKYTIQKWLTPNGNWINEKGVTPDINVELDEEFFDDRSDEKDNQLQKALEELSSK